MLAIRQLFDRATCTYTYLVMSKGPSKAAVLIDPVIEHVGRDLEVASRLGARVVSILNTHVHADHITGSGKLRVAFAERGEHVQTVISAASGAKADNLVKAGDKILIGDGRYLEVRATPGHTQGCVTFVTDDYRDAFVGDAVLVGGCGRTDFQGGSPQQLYDSVWGQILSLPDETCLWPGHDYDGRTATTVGEEKRHNPRLTLSKEAFVQLMLQRFDGTNLPKHIDTALPANMVCGVFDPDTTKPVHHPGGFLWIPKKFADVASREEVAAALRGGAAVCDVRSPTESAVEGSGWDGGKPLCVAWSDGNRAAFAREVAALVPGKDSIIFYCKTGNRAARACAFLEQEGFTNLVNGGGAAAVSDASNAVRLEG